MRLAVLSDIHGNLTALEAVIADLRTTSPDLVIQGGDVAASGSRPAEVIDRIRDLQWPGIHGNTDAMLWSPAQLADFAERAPQLKALLGLINDTGTACLAAIGRERLEWLKQLPERWSDHGVAVVHAAPGDLWRGAMPNASDEELLRTYGPLGTPRVVYGHIHVPFVRRLPALTVANSGSVSLPYDGDPRASYVLLDDDEISVRRVEYDFEEEIAELSKRSHPHAGWIASMLRSGKYQPPA